jgi:uncharacterized FAD-dependent dehydrogenase
MSLRVGGDFPGHFAMTHEKELLQAVAEGFGVSIPTTSNEIESAEAPLLTLPYPVIHIGTDHCSSLIESLTSRLRSCGADIRSNAHIRHVRLTTDGRFAIFASGNRRPIATSAILILAMGKVGADEQRRYASSLGVGSDAQPMYLGVRLENATRSTFRTFRPGLDPKFKLEFDDGTKIKTHCAATGGEVLALDYGGFVIAGGHARKDFPTDKTSVGLLWNGFRSRSAGDAYGMARTLRPRPSRAFLTVQSLGDFLTGVPSRDNDVRSREPSADLWRAGDLRAILPTEYAAALVQFLDHLRSVEPDLFTESALLYGPALEWWSARARVDQEYQTSCNGLFSVGDGAGWSQGIIHAAATGMLAGRGAVRLLMDRDKRVSVVS